MFSRQYRKYGGHGHRPKHNKMMQLGRNSTISHLTIRGCTTRLRLHRLGETTMVPYLVRQVTTVRQVVNKVQAMSAQLRQNRQQRQRKEASSPLAMDMVLQEIIKT